MGRMMPGRIRQEGIDLYEAGKLRLIQNEQGRLLLEIAGERFSYGTADSELDCTCDLFSIKGYCQHLAATEYFLKNDAKGKALVEDCEQLSREPQVVAERAYSGGLFLAEVLATRTSACDRSYQLSVEGQLLAYERQIQWTLKIRRLPDSRSYIIRDIGAFLRLVKTQGHYQIGKNYYEPISYDCFDEKSQAVLDFLFAFVPEKIRLDSDILLHFGRYFRLPQAYFEEGVELLTQLPSFVFYYQQETYSSLPILPLTAAAGLYQFEVLVHTHMIELLIHEKPVHSLFQGAYFLSEGVVYAVTHQQEILLHHLAQLTSVEKGVKQLHIDFQDQERLALVLLDFQTIGSVEAPKRFVIHPFQPSFYIQRLSTGQLALELELDFSGYKVRNEEDLQSLPFASHMQEIAAVFQGIAEAGFYGRFQAYRAALQAEEVYDFFYEELPLLQKMGDVHLDESLSSLRVEVHPSLHIERKGSLLEISFDLSGIEQGEVHAAMESLFHKKDYYSSVDGRILVFDEETKKIRQTLEQLRAERGQEGHFHVQAFAGPALSQRLSDMGHVHLSKNVQEMTDHLAHPERFPLPHVELKGELRPYQQNGVKWLAMLDHYGFGGVLADDMGLGKTLQTIAFLSHQLKGEKRALVIAPSSLIYNWQEEVERFAPQLDMVVVQGVKEKRAEQIALGHRMVVTSYSSFRQDSDLYRQEWFDYLILDEAQMIKNSQSKITQLLRNFQVGNCFALSGTPIENHLTELWSIFQIVLPGLLPRKQVFHKLDTKEIARMIQPFVLRRHKEDVLRELPDLVEINVVNELTDEQKILYLAQLQQMQERVADTDDAQLHRQKLEILSGITRLRQICDTPSLFLSDFSGESGKLNSLKELLVQLKESKKRVLIFSQFRTMLDGIEKELEELGLSAYMLTGSTPTQHRQDIVRAFNAGSRDAFLISLKAGGVGLNLTGADTVILVDLWWNPAVEAQAISRAHRMGQTQKVECYRLITKGTIEEKIQSLQESKKGLVKAVLDGQDTRSTLTVEEIRDILGIGSGH